MCYGGRKRFLRRRSRLSQASADDNRARAEGTPDSAGVTYCFRTRFRLGPWSRIQAATDELVFVAGRDGGEHVVLRPRNGVPLSEATELVLRGAGYGTRDDAEEAAIRWGKRLRLAFAQLRLGADFGLRAPQSAFTQYGLRMVGQASGSRALNDVHGTMVFECEPPPRFVSWGGELSVGKSAEQLVQLMSERGRRSRNDRKGRACLRPLLGRVLPARAMRDSSCS